MGTKKFRLPRLALYCIIAALIILPTVLAVVTVIYMDTNEQTDSSRVDEVELLDSNGNRLFYEHTSQNLTGETSLIGVFNTLYHGLEKIQYVPEVPEGTPTVILKINDKGVLHTYKCIFPIDGSPAYCTDELGAGYSIRPSDSKRFLLSHFAQSLYGGSAIPSVLSTDGETIIPSAVAWNYKNLDREYVPYHNPELTSTLQAYSMTGGIAFSFSIAPDITHVTVEQDGELVFSGVVGDLDELSLTQNDDVNVHLRAQWLRSDDKEYYGTLEYDFRAIIHSRAEFFMSDTKVSAGGFITLKATNISSLSHLKFTAASSDFSPEMLLQGTTAYILIPHASLGGKPQLDFTVSYGVATQSFTLLADGENTSSFDESMRATLSAFGIDTAESSAQACEYMFFGGETLVPNQEKYTRTLSYGDPLEYKGKTLLSCFTSYECTVGGYTVSSVGAGKVVGKGESEALGKYLIVDMGAGLLLRYFHLSMTELEIGDYIAAGEAIGKCGTLADGTTQGFSTVLSCNGFAVDSQILFK